MREEKSRRQGVVDDDDDDDSYVVGLGSVAHRFRASSSQTSSSCASSCSGGRRVVSVESGGRRPRERAMRIVGRENGTAGGIGGHGGHTARWNEVGTRREVGKRGTNIEPAAVVRGRSAFRER